MLIIVLAAACVVGVALQDVVPGRWWYHSATYALLLAATCAFLLWRLSSAAKTRGQVFGPLLVMSGAAAVVTLCGLAVGLLGPDTQTYSGAPGATLATTEPSGTLRFPFQMDPDDRMGSVQFQSRAGRSLTIFQHRRSYTGAYVMWSDPHLVATITAADAAGRRLTITQPANASFLSPVLLFSQMAKIGGRMLPVDSFSLPAVQRSVKAVLFSPTTLSQIQGHAVFRAALLVAVEDERGRMLPGAIRLVPSGQRVTVGGVALGAVIATYPSVVVAAAPPLPILLPGVIAFFAGLSWYAALKNRFRSRN
ncbi:MAG: hypothetical protein JO135_00105 [Candidatus Eremiobacteraeota bacterium]|nr:hypothetical protein [Candidatus Eremiobacteraeota bacterium]